MCPSYSGQSTRQLTTTLNWFNKPISLWFICGFYKWQHNQNIFITLLIIPEPQLLLSIFSSSSLFFYSSLILSHSKQVLYSSQLIIIMFSLSSSLSLSLSHTLSLSLSLFRSLYCLLLFSWSILFPLFRRCCYCCKCLPTYNPEADTSEKERSVRFPK